MSGLPRVARSMPQGSTTTVRQVLSLLGERRASRPARRWSQHRSRERLFNLRARRRGRDTRLIPARPATKVPPVHVQQDVQGIRAEGESKEIGQSCSRRSALCRQRAAQAPGRVKNRWLSSTSRIFSDRVGSGSSL